MSSSISYHSIHPFSTVMKQTLITIFNFIATPALWPHTLLKEVSVFTLYLNAYAHLFCQALFEDTAFSLILHHFLFVPCLWQTPAARA